MSDISEDGSKKLHGAALGLKSIVVPISFGELIDKITILEIKSERIQDEKKLHNIRSELGMLSEIFLSLEVVPAGLSELKNELRTVNEMLWDIEDRIRGCEQRKEFGQAFIELARSVYIANDRRAWVKRQINEIAHSAIIEEKSYRHYS